MGRAGGIVLPGLPRLRPTPTRRGGNKPAPLSAILSIKYRGEGSRSSGGIRKQSIRRNKEEGDDESARDSHRQAGCRSNTNAPRLRAMCVRMSKVKLVLVWMTFAVLCPSLLRIGPEPVVRHVELRNQLHATSREFASLASDTSDTIFG